MQVPQCNPKAGYTKLSDEINAAMLKVLESGWYILGNEVSEFETEFASYNNAGSCVSCANGTDAIELVLRALDLTTGSLVATVSNTAVATVSAIERAGCRPFFIDIDPDTLTISPDSLDAALQKNDIRAVVAVHLFGHPAEMEAITKIASDRNIPVIEDCAQAHGAMLSGQKVGRFGIAGTFSFYPTKNLGALGDGGAVITDESWLAERIKYIRQYGWQERYISSLKGINSRLDEIQAAILRVKLKKLDAANSRRRTIAAMYTEELSSISQLFLPVEQPNAFHVYHQYVVKTEFRNDLQVALKQHGVGTAIHYPLPIHIQPAYKTTPRVDLHNTEVVNNQILSLPMFPELTNEEVSYVIRSIKECFNNRS